MRRIGRKGGRAGKGSPARIAANRRTAEKRFGKKMPNGSTVQEPEPTTGQEASSY